MPLPRELVDAIVAHPDNVAGYLVAGDLLNSFGDPWGELITAYFQLSRETDPGRFVQWKKEIDRIRSAHASTWFGTQNVSPKWKHGFVEEFELVDAASLTALLHSELGRMTRRISIEGTQLDVGQVLARLNAAALPRLDGLRIVSSHATSAVAWQRPLRLLAVRSTAWPWNSVDPSRLEHLELSDLHEADVATWVTRLPSSLKHLEISQCELPLSTVRQIIESQKNLEILHLESDLPNELMAWLARSPALSNVKHLAIGGPMTDPGLDALLKDFARFDRLKTLILYGGRFGPDRKKWAYKQLPRVVLSSEAVPADWWLARRKS